MYIKDGRLYSLRQLRADNAEVSFPSQPSPELLAEYGVHEVIEATPPAHDPATEFLIESFSNASGIWEQLWVVQQLPPEQIAEIDLNRSLTPVQFEWLLAYTGLEDVWNGLLAATKGKDLDTYAMLRSELRQQRFILGVTLAKLDQLRPMVAQIAPDADISEPTIRAAWNQAETINI